MQQGGIRTKYGRLAPGEETSIVIHQLPSPTCVEQYYESGKNNMVIESLVGIQPRRVPNGPLKQWAKNGYQSQQVIGPLFHSLESGVWIAPSES